MARKKRYDLGYENARKMLAKMNENEKKMEWMAPTLQTIIHDTLCDT